MRAASWRPPHVIQWPKLIYTCIGDTTMEISVGDRVEFKNGVVGIVIHIGPSDGMCYSRDNGRANSEKEMTMSIADPTGMKAWARRQMRICKCGRKYIMPRLGAPDYSHLQLYRSNRKHKDLCWRCERALAVTEVKSEASVKSPALD